MTTEKILTDLANICANTCHIGETIKGRRTKRKRERKIFCADKEISFR